MLIKKCTTLWVLLLSLSSAAFADTQVVILGTGTPVPDAERSGPGVAIVTNGQAYVFDAGGGMVHKAVQAAQRYAIPELTPQNINHLFITHLHSDHIHDVSELASARWWGRQEKLKIWGPAGTADYVRHMDNMNAIEADIRAAGTPSQLVTLREGYRPEVSEIEEGLVFENDDISVEAFAVPHGDIKPSFGFKVVTADKTIVISGDTTFSEAVAEHAANADILIHEVASGDGLAAQSEFWQQYHGSSHSTTQQVAEIANMARPGLLVLTHILFFDATPGEIVNEVKRDYDGEVVLANDLDIF